MRCCCGNCLTLIIKQIPSVSGRPGYRSKLPDRASSPENTLTGEPAFSSLSQLSPPPFIRSTSRWYRWKGRVELYEILWIQIFPIHLVHMAVAQPNLLLSDRPPIEYIIVIITYIGLGQEDDRVHSPKQSRQSHSPSPPSAKVSDRRRHPIK